MIDLTRMVEVVLDQGRDDPARVLPFTPVGHPRMRQVGVVAERSDAEAEPFLAQLQPCHGRLYTLQRLIPIDKRSVPGQRRIAKGMVVVHELAAADMANDLADGALTAW